MTKSQIKYIVENILSDSMDKYTPLLKVARLKMSCNEIIFLGIDDKRVKFDSTNELLRVISVRKYSEDINVVPSHSNYDIIQQNGKYTVYEYMTDSNGLLIGTTYSFDGIENIIPVRN